MARKSAPRREAMRQGFLAEVKQLWPLAKGSLTEVRKPCVRPRCAACARGEKHRAFLFTFLEHGRRRCLYVPRELAPAVRQALARGRQLEARLLQAGVAWLCAERSARRGARGGVNRE
jgi:hypothetical protein